MRLKKSTVMFTLAATALCSQTAIACPNIFIDRQNATVTLDDHSKPYFETLLAVSDNSIAISLTSDTGLRSYSSAHVNVGEQASWYVRLDTFHSAIDIMAQCAGTPGVVSREFVKISYLRPNETNEIVLSYDERDGSLFSMIRSGGEGSKWAANCTNGFTHDDYLAKLAEVSGDVALPPAVAGSAGTDRCFEQVITTSSGLEGDVLSCTELAQSACHEVQIEREEVRQSTNGTPTVIPTSEGDSVRAQLFFSQLQSMSQGRPAKATLQGMRTLLASSDANQILANQSSGSSTIRVLRRQVAKLLRVRDTTRIRSGLARILRSLRRRQ